MPYSGADNKESELTMPKELPPTQKTDSPDLLDLALKGAAIAGGALLALEVFRHRRLLTSVGVAAGAAVWINRWLDGGSSRGRGRPVRMAKDMGSASFPGELTQPSDQAPVDAIDEAMMESFPASDPPASYRRA